MREKGETFQKIGGKGQNTYTKKRSLANSLDWGNICYMSQTMLLLAFSIVPLFYCPSVQTR